jgi:hypothetical protein
MTAFWDVAPCSLGVDRRFRGAYYLHLRLYDRGSTDFWNVDLLQRDYTALYPISSSWILLFTFFTLLQQPLYRSCFHAFGGATNRFDSLSQTLPLYRLLKPQTRCNILWKKDQVSAMSLSTQLYKIKNLTKENTIQYSNQQNQKVKDILTILIMFPNILNTYNVISVMFHNR